MPIPPFDHILNALPPHLGNPTQREQISPYPCSMAELRQAFGYSQERQAILEGLESLRVELTALGLDGFQWIGGSFLEGVETLRGRPPQDIDVVTFIAESALDQNALAASLAGRKPNLLERAAVKRQFKVDHFLLSLEMEKVALVSWTKYWYALFSHRRDDAWKGMLQIPLKEGAP